MATNRPVTRPPQSVGQLEKLVRNFVRERGLAEKRVRDWVSYMALGGVLERASGGEPPDFTVRGGVAMELRFSGRSRATKDLDLSYLGREGDAVGALDEAIRVGYGSFAFRRIGRVLEMPLATTARVEIQISYNGGIWGTVTVDVSRAEAHQMEVELIPAFDLREFGVEGPAHLPCMSARYQLAHKIHGMTRPGTDGRPNERVQDAVDALMLRELVLDLGRARIACVHVFEVRRTHLWPPYFAPPESWAGPFGQIAGDLEMEIRDLDMGATELRGLIQGIETAVD